MRFFFLLLQVCLFAADFDCVVVGSSPFSLFEALYQCHSGKKVLILEEAAQCGGAWKAIDICGICHADLGCHQVGCDMQLKAFLEEYAGCKIVSMDHPTLPFEAVSESPNGWYFSQGCFELIDHLLHLIAATDIALCTNCQVERVSIDPSQNIAKVQTKNGSYTTKKLIVTPMSVLPPQNQGKSKYYHLYLLIQDPTPPRFTYQGGLVSGSSRMMNLTHFVGLAETGRQLVVLQMHNESHVTDGQFYVDALKNQSLLDVGAYLLKAEPYIYEAGAFQQGLISEMGAQELIEVLQTAHFLNLSGYISKWKQVLKPYHDALGR